ncbi:MAG: hypothetical protein IVW53_09150 [Chloroflexi bacterium]|nr:hypothetical protein [Chloroflexota bacterium]
MDVAQATELLALATFLLGGGAFWAALEAYRSRKNRERDRDARAIRDALVELADAVRVWRTWPPLTGSLVWGMPDRPVLLLKVREMLGLVNLSAEALAYLLWSEDAVRQISSSYLDVIHDRIPQIGNPSGEPFGGWTTDEGQDLYWAALGQILDTAAVTLEECRRRRFGQIAIAFAPLFAVELERRPVVDSLFIVPNFLGPRPPRP